MLICERVSEKFDSEKRWFDGLQAIVRNLYSLIYNINRGKGKPVKTPQQLWPIGKNEGGIDKSKIIRKWNAV